MSSQETSSVYLKVLQHCIQSHLVYFRVLQHTETSSVKSTGSNWCKYVSLGSWETSNVYTIQRPWPLDLGLVFTTRCQTGQWPITVTVGVKCVVQLLISSQTCQFPYSSHIVTTSNNSTDLLGIFCIIIFTLILLMAWYHINLFKHFDILSYTKHHSISIITSNIFKFSTKYLKQVDCLVLMFANFPYVFGQPWETDWATHPCIYHHSL